MNGKSALGVLLVIIGALAVLNIFNINIGAIFGWMLPFILIGFGIYGWMNRKKVIGGSLVAIGAIMLMSKLGSVLLLLLAIGLIIAGITLFKGGTSSNRRSY
ncbi:LiaF transmembrane domain-containing protein [Paenibacillus chungangensis]|uniref:LiaF transmembrane domain-containing protein n=1 Tax=Paenibacillus chungangensis TaxID=696535 RepID=A0ABW3HV42_9BACL